MRIPPPAVLVERVAALPAGRPLVPRVRGMHGVYLVGGAVRDLLLGGAPVDLDLVVEGDALAVARELAGSGPVRIHDRFGTSTISLDGFEYDIARARSESYAHPGALPDVAPADLETDLIRRDFSVNALALALSGPDAGVLIAVPGGLEDLQGGLLRVLHDRSFTDDPTRLLRMARYASRLGFTPDPHTEELARQAVAAGAPGTVSPHRIGAELRLLAREPDPVKALAALHRFGLGPAIAAGFGLSPQDQETARRGLALLPAGGRPDLLALAVALARVEAEALRARLDQLGFDAQQRHTILAAALHSRALARALSAAQLPSEIAAAARKDPLEAVALAGALGPAEQARDWLERLRHVRLEITGEDLLSAGVTEGPAVGAGLRAALAAKLDGQAAGRESELAEALRAAGGG